MQSEEFTYPEKSEFYDFELEDETQNIYSFQTEKGILYEVRFRPSPYIFGEDKIYAPFIFELIIITRLKPEQTTGTDDRIPYTLFKIFADFYNRNTNNVCVYICESSDGKQFARERKFIQWFRYFNDGGYIQITETLDDEQGIHYPVGLIMRLLNTYRAEIINAFAKLITEYKK